MLWYRLLPQKMQSQSFIALYIRLAASFASGSNGSTETLQMLWSGYSRKNFAIAFTASLAITSQSPQYVPLIVLLLILKYFICLPLFSGGNARPRSGVAVLSVVQNLDGIQAVTLAVAVPNNLD